MFKRFSHLDLNSLGAEFSHLTDKDDGYVFFEGKKAKAFICIQPCNIEEEKGVFLHKLVLLEVINYDKIMQELITMIENDFPNQFIAVGETQKSYEELGFVNTFNYRYLTKAIKKSLFYCAEFDAITANGLYNLRQSFIEQPFVNIDKNDYIKLIGDLYASGASTVNSENGYAIYYRKKENIIVREIFAKNEQEALNLLSAISNHDSRDLIELYLPESSSLFCGEGKKIFGGMIKNCSKTNIINGIIEV